MEKLKTGIDGLDKALNGGIPVQNLVLVSGGAGTGKSTLCLQYIIRGAEKFGDKGLYVSTEQNKSEIYKQGESLGWKIQDLEKKGKLMIKYIDIVKGGNPLEEIYDAYSNFQPKRLVIDSLTTLTDAMLISGEVEQAAFSMVQVAESISPVPRTEQIVAKSMLYQLVSKLKLFSSTVMMTSELPEETNYLSADNISEFICDGVIVMHYLGVGAVDFRTMRIRKMRYTDHEKGTLPYEIGKNGIEIKPQEL